jgi:hypothetical protein
MNVELQTVLDLVDRLNKTRAGDERLAELLGEVSTGLADILAALERPAEAGHAEAMKAALTGIADTLKAMRETPPVVQVSPQITVPPAAAAAPAWTKLRVTMEPSYDGSKTFTVERLK